ncbi:hypothetical protein Back2_11950 [Nocardioides baekrokdamisoli]|uniref:Uncharacterized protein n=1 Tax=Nocardioides baekrokdamisoli TaxID=1804624 RepID=A0A3G9IZV8_9ACTN|nr:hypothetical protein Back2_11950 [Nocardioides baekrokdamisoli]
MGLVLALIAAVIVAGMIVALTLRDDHTVTPTADATAGGSPTPTTYGSLGSAPTPTGTVITGNTNGGSALGSGLTGMSGNGWAHSEPAHKVVLHAWSTAPIPALGWVVPTARAGGKLIGKVTDWSTTVTAYGPPKYAQLYLATDYRGIRVYCTITVDGVVQASGHSSGPYGDVMCMA